MSTTILQTWADLKAVADAKLAALARAREAVRTAKAAEKAALVEFQRADQAHQAALYGAPTHG